MCSRKLLSQTFSRLVNGGIATRGFKTSPGIMAPIKVGDAIPNVTLHEGNPGTKVNTQEAFGKGKHVIFAIPGAFTPTCQNEHFPTFIKDYDAIKQKGVDSVVCVSVNDAFVMDAFQKHLKAENKIRCLADTQGLFAAATELTLDLEEALGNKRLQRFAMVVQDGKVTALNVEPDSGKATCSTSSGVLSSL